MADRCIVCHDRPRLHETTPCFSETFLVRALNGAKVDLTVRVCLKCGSRFTDRVQLREHMRALLPAYVTLVEGSAA